LIAVGFISYITKSLLMGLDIEVQVLGWLVGEIAGELVG